MDYRGKDKNVIVPENKTIEGITLNVTQIESHAFYGRSVLEGIEVPSTVTYIGDSAFVGTNLSTFYGSVNLEYVASNAFDETPYLKNENGPILYLPSKDNPYCIAYKQLSIPNRYNAPSSIERVLDNVFERASFSEDNPVFPSLKYIGRQSFYSPNVAYTMTFPEAIEVGDEAFAQFAGTAISLPKVETLGDHVFESDDFLDEIYLPKTLRSIGKEIFRYCYEVKNISVPFLGPSAEEPKGISYLFGDLSEVEGSAFEEYKLVLDRLTIGGGKIVQHALEKNVGVKKLVFENIETIPTYAFEGHSELAEVILLNGAKRIDYGAFSGHRISSVYIPTTVSYLGERAFYSAYAFDMSFGYTSAAIEAGVSVGIEYHVSAYDVGDNCTLHYNVTNPYKGMTY